ncbi:C39 family peptidase [Streptomyces sp. NPDC001634]
MVLTSGTSAPAVTPGPTPSRQQVARPPSTSSQPSYTTRSTSEVPLYGMQLSNDCEAAALRMVLASRGIQTGDQAILNRMGLDQTHYQFGRSGSMSGNPFRTFVGDPNGSEKSGTGFGAYYPPVAAAARSYGLGVRAAGQGVSLGQLQAQVAQGHPAIAWVDYLWRRAATTSYTAYDGARVPYAGPAEHTVVVTGFSGNNVTVNDPARGKLSIPLSSFAAAYATYGNMAVVLH